MQRHHFQSLPTPNRTDILTANIKFDHDAIFPRNLHAEGYGDRELCHSMSTITPSTVAVPHTKQRFIEADEKVVLILTQSKFE